jgi:hypothetical protein
MGQTLRVLGFWLAKAEFGEVHRDREIGWEVDHLLIIGFWN